MLIKKTPQAREGLVQAARRQGRQADPRRPRTSPKVKIKDLTGADLDAAVRTIAGTARSMGITVEGV